MYKLIFYVPESSAEKVKNAIFSSGGGKYKNYDCCSFETKGVGQFRPLNGATPYLGEINKIEKVTELKVEMVVEKNIIKSVISAMKMAHPYEEVAYNVIEILEF